MEFHHLLDWAFQRHLNPLSWYIRPIFLIVLAFFAYKRDWKGIIITFLLMMSSMVWFPAPKTISPQMEAVLDYEKMLLSHPGSAVFTLAFMMVFVVSMGAAFWKHSFKIGLVILNVTLIGKVVLSLILTGDNGWAPIGNTLFGLLLVNGIGWLLLRLQNKQRLMKSH
ncbi:hypothetical protein [Paenibacillus sp. XY044]|uniref:hypothetical protein n=1 Tax=Paenibacillus sp. XY044 TaxID=2026089 RepID=UPI000B98FA7A|nr:hypothetical protein [Paenibacillus sp. XY044]OZB90664.1 hypothetical protein CJP46_31565 [Paenibacillus sp. XY044]